MVKTLTFRERLIGKLSDAFVQLLLISLGCSLIITLLVFIQTGTIEWYESVGFIIAILITTIIPTYLEHIGKIKL